MKTIEKDALSIAMKNLAQLELDAAETADPFEALEAEIEYAEHCIKELKKIEADKEHQFDKAERASRVMYGEELAISALVIAGIERNFARM